MKKRIGIFILVFGGWLLAGSFAEKRIAAVDGTPLFKRADFRLFRGPENLFLEHGGQSVVLPSGKLPWPHQKPGMSQAEYEELLRKLWIFDNFGSYHGSDDKRYFYFHDGLDVMLDNGTKIYAVDSGYVKSITSSCIYIGDTPGSQPGKGWEYAHTGNFQFRVGDYVFQGDYIADVEPMGHVHLSRVRLDSGAWDSKRNLKYSDPHDFFVYEDTLPPKIVTPFFYFQNNSDTAFQDGRPIEIWGDVDIVVAIRDEANCSLSGPYCYSWSVARIEYEIRGPSGQFFVRKSWDLSRMILKNWPGGMYEEGVRGVYQPHDIPLLKNTGLYGGGNFHFFYNITNTDGTEEFGEYDVGDPNLSCQNNAWKTRAVDQSGTRLFPEGLYTIIVRAYDFKGNASWASDAVRVINGKKRSQIRR